MHCLPAALWFVAAIHAADQPVDAPLPTWVEPLDIASTWTDQERASNARLRDAAIEAILVWSRSVESCEYQFTLGSAQPIDRDGGVGDWTPAMPLARTLWSGKAGFVYDGTWWEEVRHNPEMYPAGQPEDSLRMFTFSDGTVLTGFSGADSSQLIREDGRTRKGYPTLDNALGYDQSEWTVTPLYELCARHRDSFIAVDRGDLIWLHGRVPHRDPSVVAGGDSHPVTIAFDRSHRIPLSVTWHQPDAMFPTESYTMNWWVQHGEVLLPSVVSRQLYRPKALGDYRTWRRTTAAQRLAEFGNLGAADWSDPVWQSRAWRVTRDEFGPLGVDVEPLGAREGQSQPLLVVVQKLLAINSDGLPRIAPECPVGSSVVNSFTGSVRERLAGGYKDVMIDGRRLEGHPPPPMTEQGLSKMPEFLTVVSGTPADLGVLAENTDVERRVTFRNLSSKPVLASIAAKSCGCVSASIEPEIVEPGETCVLSCSTRVLPAVEPQFQQVVASFDLAGEPAPSEVTMSMSWSTSLGTSKALPASIRRRVVTGSHIDVDLYLRTTQGPPAFGAIEDVSTTIVEAESLEVRQVSRQTAVVPIRLRPAQSGAAHGAVEVRWKHREEPTVVAVQVDPIDAVSASPPGMVLPLGKITRVIRLDLAGRGSQSGTPVRAALRLISPGPAPRIEEIKVDRTSLEVRGIDCPSTPGSGRIEVFDAGGSLIASVPLAWL